MDYLVDIGVTAIWLTPFLESPLKSGGYDITNYLNVQEVFGTIDDFLELINTAHKKSIFLYILNIIYLKILLVYP